ISWMRQGPEVFNEGSGSKGKVVGAVAVVALLVAAAFGAYLLWGRGGSPNAGGQNDGTTTTTTKPNDPLLADLPGISQLPPENQIRTWADVVKLNYLTAGDKPNETTAYESGSPTDARVAISKHDDDRIIVLVVQESSPETAKQAKAQLGDLQVRYGQTPLTVQPNVLASGLDNVPGPAPVLRRAHYYSGRYVVRIEVDGANPNVADKDFRDTLTAELAKLAANA
ncbi:MAG: hypothetical protein JOZ47_11260, partial [Kutzneria sp.]|nr:hypothetical protein [Kutzneria sp.]